MEISDQGLDLIKEFEGFRSKPYLDSGGVPTIGYGTITYSDGTKVTMDDSPIDESTASDLLVNNISIKCKKLNSLIKISINQNQFDSLASFCYNLGTHALETSTLLKYLNDSEFQSAADEFPKWDKVGGKVVDGLLKRRQAERDLFLS